MCIVKNLCAGQGLSCVLGGVLVERRRSRHHAPAKIAKGNAKSALWGRGEGLRCCSLLSSLQALSLSVSVVSLSLESQLSEPSTRPRQAMVTSACRPASHKDSEQSSEQVSSLDWGAGVGIGVGVVPLVEPEVEPEVVPLVEPEVPLVEPESSSQVSRYCWQASSERMGVRSWRRRVDWKGARDAPQSSAESRERKQARWEVMDWW